MVRVQYCGTLIDGTGFDSNFNRNQPGADRGIKGLKEAITSMQECSKCQLFIPYVLAFGEKGLYADRAVIFEIELVTVIPGKG